MIHSRTTHHGCLTLCTHYQRREVRIIIEPYKLQRPSRQPTLDLLRHYIMAYLR